MASRMISSVVEKAAREGLQTEFAVGELGARRGVSRAVALGLFAVFHAFRHQRHGLPCSFAFAALAAFATRRLAGLEILALADPHLVLRQAQDGQLLDF